MTEQELAVLAIIGGNGKQTYVQALDRLEALGLVQRFYYRIPGHRLTSEGLLHLENLKAKPTPRDGEFPRPGANIHEVWK